MVVVHNEGTRERVAGKLGVVEIGDSKNIISFEEKPDIPGAHWRAPCATYSQTRRSDC